MWIWGCEGVLGNTNLNEGEDPLLDCEFGCPGCIYVLVLTMTPLNNQFLPLTGQDPSG